MRNPLDIWRGGSVWDPVREISTLQRNIDRMFEDMLSPITSGQTGQLGREVMNWSPSCDVEETESHYLMTFDLPGVNKNDVKIELRDNQLIVSGERKQEHKEGRRVQERFHGSFQRVFTLPSHVDANKIEASYEDGVLYLAVPKSEAVKPKQIQIGEKKSGIFGKILGKEEKKGEKAA